MCRVSPRKIADGFADGSFGLVSLKKREIVTLKLTGHGFPLVDCRFSGETHHFAVTGSESGSINVWDSETFREVDKFVRDSRSPKRLTALDVSANGSFVALGWGNGQVSFHSLATRQKTFTTRLHQGCVSHVILNLEHPSYLLSTSTLGRAVVYDIEGKRIVSNVWLRSSPTSALFFPQSCTDYAVSDSTGHLLFVSGSETEFMDISDDVVGSMCLCPRDQELLLAVTSGGDFLIVNYRKKIIFVKFRIPFCSATSVDWNPFRKSLVVVGTVSGHIFLVDLDLKETVWRIEGHYGAVGRVWFHPSRIVEIISASHDACTKK
jgi:WD40 repeat protein